MQSRTSARPAGPGPEPAQDPAVRADHELLEVPLDVAGVACGVGCLGEARRKPRPGRDR